MNQYHNVYFDYTIDANRLIFFFNFVGINLNLITYLTIATLL